MTYHLTIHYNKNEKPLTLKIA